METKTNRLKYIISMIICVCSFSGKSQTFMYTSDEQYMERYFSSLLVESLLDCDGYDIIEELLSSSGSDVIIKAVIDKGFKMEIAKFETRGIKIPDCIADKLNAALLRRYETSDTIYVYVLPEMIGKFIDGTLDKEYHALIPVLCRPLIKSWEKIVDNDVSIKQFIKDWLNEVKRDKPRIVYENLNQTKDCVLCDCSLSEKNYGLQTDSLCKEDGIVLERNTKSIERDPIPDDWQEQICYAYDSDSWFYK